MLRAELHAVRGATDAFRQVDQAEAVLGLVFDAALPAYRQFHRDLLFHQTEETLFQPLFIGRVCEAVLQQGGPWHQSDRIVPAALHQLNDYLGHRPVAVLRTEQKIQPYEHEWVRPIPLWIRGAGAAGARIVNWSKPPWPSSTPPIPALLFEAMFALEQLDELAFDPRAYDFDHPVNKRPNYLFGQWDMNKLDNAGRCRRFVLQQVTLDAMLDRLARHGRLPHRQVLFEEAAVLAGTMLMGSGVSGNRPDAHDSTVTLATLVEKIAVYRDAFYEDLLRKTDRRARRAVACRGAVAAAAVRRGAATLQPLLGAAAGPAIAARPRGATVRGHRLHRSGGAAGRRRADGLGPHDLRDALPAGRRPSGRRARQSGRGGRAVAAGGRIAARGDRVRGDGRSLEHPGLRRPVQPLSRRRKLRPRPSRRRVARHGGRHLRALRADSQSGGRDRRNRPATDALRKPRRAGPLVGPVRHASKSARWTGFPARPRSNRPSTWPRRCGRGTKAAPPPATWPSGGSTSSSFARPRPTPWSSRRCWTTAIRSRRWRCWCNGSARPRKSRWSKKTIRSTTWRWCGWRISGVAKPVRPARRRGYGGQECRPPPPLPLPACRAYSAAARQRWPLARKFLDYLEANAEEYWQVPRFEMAAEILGDDAAAGKRCRPRMRKRDLFGAAYEDVTYRDSTDDGVEGEMFETGRAPPISSWWARPNGSSIG